jgi:hypothetical protein
MLFRPRGFRSTCRNCHPERGEGSLRETCLESHRRILRCAQNDIGEQRYRKMYECHARCLRLIHCRLLLSNAMNRAQAPHQIGARNTDDMPSGEEFL